MREKITAFIILVLWASAALAGTYSGGTGEPNDPYRIATAEDLNDIGNHQEDWDKHFRLVGDISLAAYSDTQFNMIGERPGNKPFSGVFDGSGHTISKFRLKTPEDTSVSYIGLFRYVGSGGTVKNLRLENAHIRIQGFRPDVGEIWGAWYVGCLVGQNGGTCSNCRVTGSIVHGVDSFDACLAYHSYIGGLVGCNSRGVISHCHTAISAEGIISVGGLVGENRCGRISDSSATGSVIGRECVGGLVGSNSNSLGGRIDKCTISNSFSTCSVNAAYRWCDLGYDVGGLLGWNSLCMVSNCYAIGPVSGYENIGGLAGFNGGLVTNCYAAGNTNGQYEVGGLVGYGPGDVADSFWDIQATSQSSSKAGKRKTTSEMQRETTFTDAGWDFVEVWNIGENQTYPFLRTHPAGDINHDDKVNFADVAILAEHWLQGTEP